VRRLNPASFDTKASILRQLGWLRIFAIATCSCFSIIPLSPVILGVAVACEGAGEEEKGHSFISTGVTNLKGKALTIQAFDFQKSEVDCKRLEVTSGQSALKSTTLKMTVQYGECSGFGLALAFSPVEYELNAEGTVKILKSFTIKDSGGFCTITVPAQGPLTKVSYSNLTKKIDVDPFLKTIASEGHGTVCFTAHESEDAYFGEWELEAPGFTLEWK
jgi:hypothetical protein